MIYPSLTFTLRREEFIRLHKHELLASLKDYFDTNYAGRNLRKPVGEHSEAFFEDLPERGEFDIDAVLESKYFFS